MAAFAFWFVPVVLGAIFLLEFVVSSLFVFMLVVGFWWVFRLVVAFSFVFAGVVVVEIGGEMNQAVARVGWSWSYSGLRSYSGSSSWSMYGKGESND